MVELKALPAVFVRTDAGNEPVREWLKTLSVEDRKAMGGAIKAVEVGWPVGMPLCRPLSGHKGLNEVRENLTNGKIGRVNFTIKDARMVLLHGFVKKAQKTPKKDIDVAAARQKGLK